jgi:hypothetical protein
VQHGGRAWYDASRTTFVRHKAEAVAGKLAAAATSQGWSLEPEQQEEWEASVGLLRQQLRGSRGTAIRLLSTALESPEVAEVDSVILEYDLRRRGLRMDCVLLAPGLVVVVEFKRGGLGAAEREQVMGYCTSLVEFHDETQRALGKGAIVVPVLVRTQGKLPKKPQEPAWLRRPYQAVLEKPICCDGDGLGAALRDALALRRSRTSIERVDWLASSFSPSSTILDAAISLYGEHDVSAIRSHAAPVEEMRACTEAIRAHIEEVLTSGGYRVVFLSGAPGAGKTLVGLDLAFDRDFREQAVFVTGNAPLVDVLDRALKSSYVRSKSSRGLIVESGYAREHARSVIDKSTLKLVKAHHFLGERGQATGSTDGNVLVFDEGQRTYEKGRMVARKKLPDHEAYLILQAMERSYPQGAVVVALLGQGQAINRGELGAGAWFEAAERRRWRFAVHDRTLQLPELVEDHRWAGHELRLRLGRGHLNHSLRYYRNEGLERWAHHLMEDQPKPARALARKLHAAGDTIWLTRDLDKAKAWARRMRVAEERSGLIGSSQARRLAALGLHVELKPDIAAWMLAPSDDFRSSNSLETIQNQYQVQGLELDWTVVCWGADLRRVNDGWKAFKLSGGTWQRDSARQVACNSYRVLLTRARKGMVVFVPRGDRTGEDSTRTPEFYDATAEWLRHCGAHILRGG